MNLTNGKRFEERERRLLLSQPGIGPTVIARMEAAGIHSLEALQSAGVPFVVAMVCDGLGTGAWSNRAKALSRALDQWATWAAPAVVSPVVGVHRERQAQSLCRGRNM
jgi:type II secretory pathway component PulF